MHNTGNGRKFLFSLFKYDVSMKNELFLPECHQNSTEVAEADNKTCKAETALVFALKLVNAHDPWLAPQSQPETSTFNEVPNF